MYLDAKGAVWASIKDVLGKWFAIVTQNAKNGTY